jgi:branched-chain amino acid transport system substrate-binding protein
MQCRLLAACRRSLSGVGRLSISCRMSLLPRAVVRLHPAPMSCLHSKPRVGLRSRIKSASLLCLLGIFFGGLQACQPVHQPVVVLKHPDGSHVARPTAPSDGQESAAQKLAADAERLQRAGENAAALRKRETLLAKYPASLAAAEIWEARAKLYASQSKPLLALAAYEKIIFYRPTFSRIATVRLAYADLLQQSSRFDDAVRVLQEAYQTAQSVGEEVSVGKALAQAQIYAGNAGQALERLVALTALPQLGEAARQDLQAQAIECTTTNLGFASAQELFKSKQSDPAWAFVQPLLTYKLAKIYYHIREYSQSETLLAQLSERYPDSSYAQDAQQFLQFMRARFEVEPQCLGVLLPLSGKYRLFGERSLQAIQLALKDQLRSGALSLVIKDTQGEPNLAAQAVESLVLQHHVIAVMGPLFSGEAMAAALKAEEMSVPMLTFSHREGLPALGPYIYRNALTVPAQAKALAKVAFERLGFRRFAMLYPKSRYGLEFMAAFWDEVTRRHGEIRGIEAYEPDQTTFREPVRRLVGRWFLASRPDFKAAMEELRLQKYNPLRLRSEVEKLDKTLPPIVDFQAVVIPDSGRQIGLIAPALAFEDVVLTHDPRTLERIKKATKAEVRPITFLGASTWNSPQTLDGCDNYCEDAVFVDAFFPNSTDPKVLDFIASFREVSGGAEPFLSEAQAYDSAAMLASVIGKVRPQSRKALMDALNSAEPFVGVSGRWKFDAEGEADKELYVLTIKDHAIRLLEDTPETRPKT